MARELCALLTRLYIPEGTAKWGLALVLRGNTRQLIKCMVFGILSFSDCKELSYEMKLSLPSRHSDFKLYNCSYNKSLAIKLMYNDQITGISEANFA